MIKKELLVEKGLAVISSISAAVIILMFVFIVAEAIPTFSNQGFFNFAFGINWKPDLNQYGVFPMVIGSILVTLIALIIAIPLSVSCAIFLEEIAPGNVRELFRPVIQTLAGIPSVVYGFFGLTFLIPIIRQCFGGSGFSIIAAAIILAIMILPTIISISQDSIRSVPQSYKEASLGLGANEMQTIKNIILPAALPGIFTAIILGFSRAIGETLAVLMVVGNVAIIPDSIFDPARTLTSNIALEMSYASGMHYHALFATSIILLLLVMALLLMSNKIKDKWGN